MLGIDLSGKVAVVIGAGRSQAIGANAARMLALCGSSVVTADLDGAATSGVAEEIQQDGGKAVG